MFRYRLLNKYGGWWFDTDCVCLKDVSAFIKLTKIKNFVIGETPDQLVNGSVMFFNDKLHMKNLINMVEEKLNNKNINFVWGEIGPYLLTSYIEKNNLSDSILPPKLFYEIGPEEFHLLFSDNPKIKKQLEKRLEESYVSHLWNEMYRRFLINKFKLPPKNSTMHKLFEENNVSLTKRYGRIINIRFYKPINYFFRIVSRLKIIFKNLRKG